MKKKITAAILSTIAIMNLSAMTTTASDPNYVTIGDVNSDGKIDASDATDVLQEYSALSVGGKFFESETQTFLADITADNKVDASDATEILNTYTDLAAGIEHFGVEGCFLVDVAVGNKPVDTTLCKSYEESLIILDARNPNKGVIKRPYVATIRKVYIVHNSKDSYSLKNYDVYHEINNEMTY